MFNCPVHVCACAMLYSHRSLPHMYVAVTVSLNTTGFPLSAVEGTVLQVCVYISQDAAGGRECPIDVALSFSYGGDKPGE